MKAKQLIVLSVFVVVAASIVLGCTGANTVLNNPTPAPTTVQVVPDNPTAMPTDVPAIVPTDVPTITPPDDSSYNATAPVNDTTAMPDNTTSDNSTPDT